MYHKDLGADLGYNILERMLIGEIDGVSINAQACSGGRAGSKIAGVVNPILANNAYLTHVRKQSKRAGGPIVMGMYYLRTHEGRVNWVRLVPFKGNNMQGRDGFAIHGRGPRGSDGCIVPTDFHVVQLLHKLVHDREQVQKPAPTLAVYAIGDFDTYDKNLARWASTA